MTTTDLAIPFFPPDLFEGDREVLLRLLRETGTAPGQQFILGEQTALFERELAERLGAADVVACSSGTSALTLALAAMEVGPGDEVVVPAFGCAPLASSVLALGAVPVFADVDPWTMVLDPGEAERRITGRTKALMPAHMFSVMADLPTFAALAGQYGLRLLEDSAVAQGGVLAGRAAGLWGEAGVYSFVQVKTFGMPGEGGAVVTRDAGIGRVVRMLRNHGQDGRTRFRHHRIGWNSRFDELQAAFQRYRLPGLAGRLARRAEIAAYYTERFAPLAGRGIQAPPAAAPERDGRCFYVYTLLAERRDELAGHLAARGVASHAYYPLALPRQPAFAPLARPGDDWPAADRAAEQALSIPVYPHLTDPQVELVADAVCEFATN
ncbi:DegT/DnrJ/EryC1/StrS family aminotransferase [Streptomyces tateyamensis]|uniref:DegT/DnrJ/EryC1/StrS family aminotransferase n=1 Tax=Streptomyces tateyamensis TaxID=565073 RepID=A0A2V4NLK4_9ACTN|nr:DegT/DnrJ/EryC1/StrS family aminotransferase [Streptomyces tateyamensis]PYC80523.1 DegT/DnrJ/EryC1/StrS family aminotransferase [Streptomyces tateyamensis]